MSRLATDVADVIVALVKLSLARSSHGGWAKSGLGPAITRSTRTRENAMRWLTRLSLPSIAAASRTLLDTALAGDKCYSLDGVNKNTKMRKHRKRRRNESEWTSNGLLSPIGAGDICRVFNCCQIGFSVIGRKTLFSKSRELLPGWPSIRVICGLIR